jgi:guanylate kinase
VDDVASAGKICILDIDVQGAQSVKESALEPHYIFIEPPSMPKLEARLRGRGTESEEQVNMRLKQAYIEMEYGTVAGNFEINIVNDKLDDAYAQLPRWSLLSMLSVLQAWYPSMTELQKE